MTAEPPIWRTAQQIADLYDVKIRTVRMWERRGHITAIDGHYDLITVVDWYDNKRNAQMDDVRQGVAHRTTSV